jgi:hypothetical protein
VSGAPEIASGARPTGGLTCSDELFVDRARAGRALPITLAACRLIARAAMAATPAVQREAIRRAIETVGAVRRRLGLWRDRLTSGNERRQPLDIFLVRRCDVLRPRLELRLL